MNMSVRYGRLQVHRSVHTLQSIHRVTAQAEELNNCLDLLEEEDIRQDVERAFIEGGHLYGSGSLDHIYLAPEIRNLQAGDRLQHGREVILESGEESCEAHEEHLAWREVLGCGVGGTSLNQLGELASHGVD